MAPQPFSRHFQGDNQVIDRIYLQSWGDKIETSDPPSRKSSPNPSLVPRGATTPQSRYYSNILCHYGYTYIIPYRYVVAHEIHPRRNCRDRDAAGALQDPEAAERTGAHLCRPNSKGDRHSSQNGLPPYRCPTRREAS